LDVIAAARGMTVALFNFLARTTQGAWVLASSAVGFSVQEREKFAHRVFRLVVRVRVVQLKNVPSTITPRNAYLANVAPQIGVTFALPIKPRVIEGALPETRN
jgi:hypothetical protein